MAIPSVNDKIFTNLMDHELERILAALESGEATQVSGSELSIGGGGNIMWLVDYEEKRYLITKFVGTVVAIRQVSSDT